MQTPHSKKNAEEAVCRFCLSEQEDDENPLISPCECQGSSGLIHLKCLQEWLEQNRSMQSYESALNFIWKINSCELCQAAYPDKYKSDKMSMDIFHFDKPEGLCINYAVVEVLGL